MSCAGWDRTFPVAASGYTILYYKCFCISFVLEALIVLTLINRLLVSVAGFKKLGVEHLNPSIIGVNE